MSETPLNMLKKKGREYACAVLARLNLAAEEEKLRKCYTRLGKMLHGLARGKSLIDIKDCPRAVEILGEIEERTRSVNAMKKQIESGKK